MDYKESLLSQKQNQVFDKVEQLLRENENGSVCIAIEGMSGSGKTTFAKLLASQFPCNLFHMDDFFLRPEQRTPNRLKETGGNVDYERFKETILQPIFNGEDIIKYQIYDCKVQKLSELHMTERKKLTIIEGSYSMHPYFGNCYDYKIFLEVPEDIQKYRILKRNGELMLTRFLNEWIPKENAYFEAFNIREKSNIIFQLT